MTIAFAVHANGARVELDAPRVAIVGYSGRDELEVERHIAELERIGVPRPDRVPFVMELPDGMVVQDDRLVVASPTTSGEVEPVLIFADGTAYLSVGSDHTDRELERTSMEAAKGACPKPLARECWPLDEVRDRWDDIVLRSSVRVDGEWRPYQDGTLAALRPLEWFEDQRVDGQPLVLFCGTVSVLGEVDYRADAFRAELVLGPRTLRCGYEIAQEA